MNFTFIRCHEQEVVFTYFDRSGLAFAETNCNWSISAWNVLWETNENDTSLGYTSRIFDVIVIGAIIGSSSIYTIGSIAIPPNTYMCFYVIDFNFFEDSGDHSERKETTVSIGRKGGVGV